MDFSINEMRLRSGMIEDRRDEGLDMCRMKLSVGGWGMAGSRRFRSGHSDQIAGTIESLVNTKTQYPSTPPMSSSQRVTSVIKARLTFSFHL